MMETNSFINGKLVVGLGNPGNKYKNTKHNIGFILLDTLITQDSRSWLKKSNLNSEIIKIDKTIFAKPLTFMNDSGIAVSKILSFYKLNINDLIVIHDDADLELGRIKLAKNSSSAGHHGIESIHQKLGTLDFYRIRIGIGRPQESKFVLHDYVLSDFKPEDLDLIIKNFESFLKTI